MQSKTNKGLFLVVALFALCIIALLALFAARIDGWVVWIFVTCIGLLVIYFIFRQERIERHPFLNALIEMDSVIYKHREVLDDVMDTAMGNVSGVPITEGKTLIVFNKEKKAIIYSKALGWEGLLQASEYEAMKSMAEQEFKEGLKQSMQKEKLQQMLDDKGLEIGG